MDSSSIVKNNFNKKIFFVFGKAKAGKDLFINVVRDNVSGIYNVKRYSVIEPIMVAARALGWEGYKDTESRNFLYNLKKLSIDYNYYPLLTLEKEIRQSRADVFFVIFRDYEDSVKLKQLLGASSIKTINIVGDYPACKRSEGNPDDSLDYPDEMFDYVFKNSSSLEDFQMVVENSEFIKREFQ